MKLVIFVEGHTEHRVLKPFIHRWLGTKEYNIGLQVVRFEGVADLIRRAPKKAKWHLKEDKVIAVFSFLDLYGANIYPDDKKSASERYVWGKQYIEKLVNDSRFKHFFAVHEIEAWLLSDPKIFKETKLIEAIKKKSANPEEVNFEKPPAKFLEDVYKRKKKKKYKKTTDGTDLFKKLDPEVAYKKCPKLREFLDEVLRVVQTAAA